MQHSLFLWWVTVVVVAGMGGIVGVFCSQTARCYDGLLRTGAGPDRHTLVRAGRAALSATFVSIIWVHGHRWSETIDFWVGLASAVMLASMYAGYGRHPEFVALSIVYAMLLLMSCIDVRVCLLPDALTRPLLWLGLLCAWLGVSAVGVQASLTGVVVGYGLLALPRALWRKLRQQECVGAGDVKLLAALGAWTGGMAIVYVLTLACIAGAVFAVLHQRRWRPSGAYPFGPFIAGAGLAEILSSSGLQSFFYV